MHILMHSGYHKSVHVLLLLLLLALVVVHRSVHVLQHGSWKLEEKMRLLCK